MILQRPEREISAQWGIYVVTEERWLPLVYKSEMEAAAAVTALRAYHGASS